MTKKIIYNCMRFDTFYCMDQITSKLNSPTLYTASWSKGLRKRLDMVEVQGLLWSWLGSPQKCQAVLYFSQKHLLYLEYIHSFTVDIFGTNKKYFVMCTSVSLLTRLHLWPKPTISKSYSHYLVWHIGTNSLKIMCCLHVLSWGWRQKFCQHMNNGLPKLHGIISWRTVIKIKFSSQPLVKTYNTNFIRISSWFMTDMRRDMTSIVVTDCMKNT
jgi:hypothetical protein